MVGSVGGCENAEVQKRGGYNKTANDGLRSEFKCV